jgi:hypothetical protein
VTFNSASAVTGAMIWRRLSGRSSGADIGRLAGWGALAAAGHFVFVPAVSISQFGN